ncbi:MAG: helix-turn-helix domain-containing protein [Anaerolineae bacterium]|nr:helix-turn-helix domain-containing protein [Anaerolineae bacterium]
MSQNQAIELRAKIIGVLLRDARLAARKTKKEVGEAIGVSTATISSYELGRKSPSLPEIEIFCLFLSIPINHFWSAETMSEQPGPANNLHVEQLLDLRKGIIAAMVAKARTDAGLTLKELSTQSGITTGRIRNYERGKYPIPLPELETLSAALDLSIKEFSNPQGPVSEWIRQQAALEGILELPSELLDFIGKPVNHPYIEVAKKLSDMSADNIRGIAETLLEISL